MNDTDMYIYTYIHIYIYIHIYVYVIEGGRFKRAQFREGAHTAHGNHRDYRRFTGITGEFLLTYSHGPRAVGNGWCPLPLCPY
jgi:hypothetical protein